MENASKALLIVGVIMLVMALIALGIYVFVRADKVARTNVIQMTAEEKELFNNQFISFADRTVYGSEVKNVVQKVNSSNQQYEGRTVDITYPDDVNGIEGIVYTRLYNITLNYSNEGIVNEVVIGSRI